MIRRTEGADFEVTIEHLQPWEVPEHRALQHAHAFHMRYYHSALAAHKLDRVTLRTRAGNRDFYRVAASAHYEVGHANPNHADVEICPICGRTGEYAQPGREPRRAGPRPAWPRAAAERHDSRHPRPLPPRGPARTRRDHPRAGRSVRRPTPGVPGPERRPQYTADRGCRDRREKWWEAGATKSQRFAGFARQLNCRW